ncbi:ABC transporter ATP-binding protein [Achromobacter sp. 413638]|uniref:ABC transporter ATP-binding protein n=1 Tax=Achromobacter sp. 413638 TaxID=3342385 RepID=UPI00370CBA23
MNAPAPESGGAAIAVRGLRHAYNGHSVLDGVDLDVPAGTVLALLGPSGCGKSTLLKALAGLLRPQSGSIRIGGQTAFDGRRHDPPEARGLGMVFQDYALWPHMSVAQNVGFPLEMRGVPRRERPGRVAEALALVGLEALAGRRPSELSGGQQQRVALARAIVARPRLLLFDEPLSNLDRDLRETLCAEIGALLRRLGATAVYVTHDHQEAHALAHVIACMRHGQIVPTPEALRASPSRGRHCGPAEPDPRGPAA